MYDQGVNDEDISNVVWGTAVESARTRAHQLFCEIHGRVSGGMASGVEAGGRRKAALRGTRRGSGSRKTGSRNDSRVGGSIGVPLGPRGHETMTGRRRLAQGLSRCARGSLGRVAINGILLGRGDWGCSRLRLEVNNWCFEQRR